MATKAVSRFEPQEFLPGAHIHSDEDLAVEAGNIATTIFHPVSTCKMGSDPMAVVDERLRVHGLQGVRIVDASVMPTITSGNTNSPVIMIAEKASDMIKEDRATKITPANAGKFSAFPTNQATVDPSTEGMATPAIS